MSAVELERDARLFFDAVYGTKPERTVIAVGPAAKPHYVYDTDGALVYVVDKVDAFTRVTLLATRPKSGRGTAADAVAVPGFFADLDVNGSPNGRGGVVRGAFDTSEQALELAHGLLTPTIVVGSGYGVQCLWLFEDVLTIATDAERGRLEQHATAWLHVLRERAGVEKFDSVADLARIMRPPGSLNGKGADPVPVRLLASDGPRYTLETFAELAPVSSNGRRARSTVAPAGVVDVVRFLDEHPRLVRFVKRTGKRPSDGSPSAWDFALACAAAERGASDEQIAALIQHARQQHDDPKGERDDYLERTLAAVRQRVPSLADGGRDAILEMLTELVGVAELGLRVVHVIVTGHGSRAMATLVLSDGSSIEFGRLDDAAAPMTLARRIAADVGVAVEFDSHRAQKVAALMRRYAGRQAHEKRHADAVDWGVTFLRLAEICDFRWGDADERWATWSELATRDPDERNRLGDADTPPNRSADAYARRALVARDVDSGRRYVRAGWMQEYVRRLGADASASDVIQLLERAGWRRPDNSKGRIEVYAPRYRDRGPGAHLGHPMFVVPPGWEDAQVGSEEPC